MTPQVPLRRVHRPRRGATRRRGARRRRPDADADARHRPHHRLLETAFVSSGGSAGALGLRFFSPLAEVAFCGHATVTAVALADRHGPGDLRLETMAGVVDVRTKPSDDAIVATLASPPTSTRPATADEVRRTLDALRWSADDLTDPACARRVRRHQHLVLAAWTRERLADLDYDFALLGARWRSSAGRRSTRTASHSVFHARNPSRQAGSSRIPRPVPRRRRSGATCETSRSSTSRRASRCCRPGHGAPSRLLVDLDGDDRRVRVTGSATQLFTAMQPTRSSGVDPSEPTRTHRRTPVRTHPRHPRARSAWRPSPSRYRCSRWRHDLRRDRRRRPLPVRPGDRPSSTPPAPGRRRHGERPGPGQGAGRRPRRATGFPTTTDADGRFAARSERQLPGPGCSRASTDPGRATRRSRAWTLSSPMPADGTTDSWLPSAPRSTHRRRALGTIAVGRLRDHRPGHRRVVRPRAAARMNGSVAFNMAPTATATTPSRAYAGRYYVTAGGHWPLGVRARDDRPGPPGRRGHHLDQGAVVEDAISGGRPASSVPPGPAPRRDTGGGHPDRPQGTFRLQGFTPGTYRVTVDRGSDWAPPGSGRRTSPTPTSVEPPW